MHCKITISSTIKLNKNKNRINAKATEFQVTYHQVSQYPSHTHIFVWGDLKRVGKSQREISKDLERSKTAICNYLKSSNKYGSRKPTGWSEKLSPQFKRWIVRKVKKKTSSTSKVLESLVDAPCSTKTIRRHLNNEKMKHKRRIHRPRLTVKHRETTGIYSSIANHEC